MSNIEDRAIRKVAEAALHGQESLLWSGRPNPWRAAIRNLSQSFFGLLWTAFVVFMFFQFSSMNSRSSFSRSSTSGFTSFFQLFLGVFLLVGIGMILSPIWYYAKARRRVYALTEQRALIIERFPTQSVRSYFARDISFIDRQGDDMQGNIIFAREARTYRRRSGYTRTYMAPIGFLGIKKPREVEALMLQTFRSEK